MLLSGRKWTLVPRFLVAPAFFSLLVGSPLRIGLLPGEAVAPDFQIELFAERVHAANADAVQSAGNFVGRGIELAAGVQLGHHHLRRRNFFAVDVHVVHRNAAAVVDHRDGVVEVNGDVDFVGVTGQRFVDRVVHHFVDQMVQAHLAGRADVHGGALAHRFHAAEHLDGVGGVVAVAASACATVRGLAVGGDVGVHFSVFRFCFRLGCRRDAHVFFARH